MDNKIKNIITGCIEGDLHYQQELYDMFSKRMYGLCLRYAGDSEEAKDILQDGFIKVFGNLKQYSFTGSFEGWVRRIFVNTAIENFRSKKMKFSDIEVNNLGENFSFDNITSKISAQELINIISELSPQYKLVFNLYAIEGYNHKEIGEMLNISEGTSKSNLSRARSVLQVKVRNHMPID